MVKRGRRLAILLAGALPLLAEKNASASTLGTKAESIAAAAANSVSAVAAAAASAFIDVDGDVDENDSTITDAVQAIHYDDDDIKLPHLSTIQSPQPEVQSSSITTTPEKDEDQQVATPVEEETQLQTQTQPQTDKTGHEHSEDKTAANVSDVDVDEDEVNRTNSESASSDQHQQNVQVQDQPSNKEDQQQQHVVPTIEGKQDKPITDASYNKTHEKNESSSDVGKEKGTPVATHNIDEDNKEIKQQQQQQQQLDETKNDEATFNRFAVDYASKSAGALILEKSSNFQGTSNLLNGDKDRYAISPCDVDKKFVVIGLSEDILVKQIKLFNYERFSSQVKEFQVQGSQTMEKWEDMGSFQAKSGNGEQSFDLKEPIWARYLKFRFLSHHGAEHYCTISQIMVHGSTMVQGFHESWDATEEQDELNAKDVSIDDIEVQTIGENHPEQDNKVPAIDADDSDKDKQASDDNIIDDTQNSKTEGDEAAKSADSSSTTTTIATNNNNKKLLPPFDLNARNVSTFVAADITVDQIPAFLASQTGTTTSINNILQDAENAELFSSLYDLIPETLSSLSLVSRQSPGRKNQSDANFEHKIGTAAFESIFLTSRIATDVVTVARRLWSADASEPIVLPKMNGPANRVPETQMDIKSNEDETESVPERSVPKASPEAKISKPENEHEEVKATQTMETKVPQTPPKESAPDTSNDGNEAVQAKATPKDSKPMDVKPAHAAIDTVLLNKVLETMPTADCLSELDYAEFKAKLLAGKKGSTTTTSSAGSGTPMEPIFKKLTNEIKALQTNLYVQEQFTKSSAACYQRVLLDLMSELDLVRTEQDLRLQRLEEQLGKSSLDTIYDFAARKGPKMIALSYSSIIQISQVTVELLGSAFNTAKAGLLQLKKSPSVAKMQNKITDKWQPITAFMDQTEKKIGNIDLGELGDGAALIPMFHFLGILIILRVLMLLNSCRSPAKKVQKKDSRLKQDPPASPGPTFRHRPLYEPQSPRSQLGTEDDEEEIKGVISMHVPMLIATSVASS